MEEKQLSARLVRELRERSLKIASAESCTGGLIAKMITDIPGASAVFDMGAVTYSNEMKTKLLDVPPELLAQYGAVSSQTARAMAEGVRRAAGADIGIATTGIAGPDGGTPDKPVGLVYIALADARRVRVDRLMIDAPEADRDFIRCKTAEIVLGNVLKFLEDDESFMNSHN